MPNTKMTPKIVKDAVLAGLKESLARAGVVDVWLDEFSAVVGQDGNYFDARFNAVVATDLGVDIMYYLSVEPEYTAEQIDHANGRLAAICAQASSRRAELKATLAVFREKMPAICEALEREGIEAHFVDAGLFGLLPTAVVCEILPSMRFSWRDVHGDLIVGHASGMEADDVFSSVVVNVAGDDRERAMRLLTLFADGALGYSPSGTKIADRITAMANA